MTTTIEALKVRLKDRFRLKSCKLKGKVLTAHLRTGSSLDIHFEYVQNGNIEITKQEWTKSAYKQLEEE